MVMAPSGTDIDYLSTAYGGLKLDGVFLRFAGCMSFYRLWRPETEQILMHTPISGTFLPPMAA